MKKTFALVLFVLTAGLLTGSCTSFATVQGVPQETIPIVTMVPEENRPTGSFIASYVSVWGICAGYEAFAENIKGRGEFDLVHKTYFPGIIEIQAISK